MSPASPPPARRAFPRSRTALSVVAAVAATALLPVPASTASTGDVDPSTLTPALNPTFAWRCAATGGGITCHGERRTEYGPEPAGFDCDGAAVYVTGRGEDRMTRWHTADGAATRTVATRSFPEDRLTLAEDGSGPAAVSRQHWTQHYRYPTPGDLSTRALVETGQVLVVIGPAGSGKVFQLTGRTEFAPGADFEVVESFHGRDDFAAGRDFVAEVCGALT